MIIYSYNGCKKLFILIFIIHLLLSACSVNNEGPFSNSKMKALNLKDTNGLDLLVQQYANNIELIWGINEVVIAGPKDYVKYTDQYQTRSHIDFDHGIITFETIASINPIRKLKKAIITTLLMSSNIESESFDLFSKINYYTKKTVKISKKPFLYGQVLDHNNKPIRWEWRANKFADYLLKKKLKQRKSELKTIIWFITIKIKLINNTNNLNLDQRAHKYLPFIYQAANKYGVDQSLILAIIQIESSFNPDAVSGSDALGLMQIIPNTAGRDIFRSQGKSGMPSRNYLFDPANNIELGTAYLSLLQNIYLAEIKNATSRRYATISAYHGGASNVLRVFHTDKKLATKIINKMSPNDVYHTLVTKHPAAKSRDYLIKVNHAQKIMINNNHLFKY